MNLNELMPTNDAEDDQYQKMNPVSSNRKSSGDKSSNQNTKIISHKPLIKKRKVSELKLGTTNTDSSNSGLETLQIPKKQPSQGSQKS